MPVFRPSLHSFRPRLLDALKDYDRERFLKDLGAGITVGIVALPLAIPAYAAFLFAPTLPMVLLAIAVMNFLLSSGLGPCVALAMSLVSPSQRGVTATIMLIVQNMLAFALGPLLIGIASDALKPAYGEEALRYALAMMLVAPLVASLLLWNARRRISAV